VTGLGLFLGALSSVAINGGYAMQHSSASALPPLIVRRPFHSLGLLLRSGRWTLGFFAGIGGWVLYVVALAIAPLSLVQAASAGGIVVLAIGGPRLTRAERVGVSASLAGLLLLALSLGSQTASTHGSAAAVVVWMLASAGVAGATARLLPPGAGLGTSAGVLYAAGDVGTKAALAGGERLFFVPALLACHGAAFACMQLSFQRGGRLMTAGVAQLWTNALPIVAGTLLFGEGLPGGWQGFARVAAFALVLVGAVALSRREPPAAEPVAAPA
jgi:hypothetical protein